MSLSPQFLDELRARTTLSALIGRKVRLKKAGNEWQGLCPFHNEKSGSFYVNDDKAFAHCFGCSWHGDAIKWVQESEGLEFLDAVRQLADQAGLEMPARDGQQQQRDQRLAGFHGVTAEGEAWFRQQLQGIAGSEARDYLQRRGITAATAQKFGLGFAPNSRTQLRRALQAIGDQQLLEVGLLAQGEDGTEPYDRFRQRVIIPIHDARGRTIAFAGRILGDGKPKYLNSPDTPLFDKGRTLFNFHRAGPAARKSGRMVVVEGHLDVIALDQAGLPETVAGGGTALTEAQMQLLWRIVPEPFLCFDGDKAGQAASAKAAIRALPHLAPGRTLRFALLPAGKDPDDMVRGGGLPAMEELLGKAVPLVELLWRHEHDAEPLATPEAKAALRERLVQHARTIQHQDVAQLYEQEFRTRVDALFERARSERQAWKPRKKGERWKPAPAPSTLPEGFDPALSVRTKTLTAIIRGLVRHPKVAREELERVACLRPETKVQHDVLELLVNAALDNAPMPEAAAVDELFPDDRGYRGLAYGFLKPNTYQPRAEEELRLAISMALAIKEGVPVEELVKMLEAHPLPEQPDKGKLL